MVYSYKDVLAHPRYNELSEEDKRLAQQYPDAGMSILSRKDQYASATTAEGRAAANQGANDVRQSYGGYTGGASGSNFNLSPISPASYNDQYKAGIDALLGDMQKKTQQLQNFRYDPLSDPQYQAYRKEYLREGKRAVQDTMGSYAGMTGGVPSTAAVTAAGQMGSYYNAQLTDKIPELYQNAYNRALQEIQQQGNTAQLMMDQSNTGYNRLLDEISHQRQVRNEESQARQEQFNRAQVAAQYGDYSQLEDYGINTQMAKAIQAANFGDYTQLKALGIDTGNAEFDAQMARAVQAAQYGDYSMLKALGVDTSSAEFEKDFTIAQIAAAYGDSSLMRSLLNSRGASLTATSTGSGSGSSGKSSGGSSGGSSGSTTSSSAGTTTDAIAAARARNAGSGLTTDNYANAYGGLSEADIDAINQYNAQNHGYSSFDEYAKALLGRR